MTYSRPLPFAPACVVLDIHSSHLLGDDSGTNHVTPCQVLVLVRGSANAGEVHDVDLIPHLQERGNPTETTVRLGMLDLLRRS